MSTWDRNECPYCGALYGRLRTGLNYMAVYDMMHVPSDDPRAWRYRHRNAVLGAWHAIKLRLWEEHVQACAMLAGERAAG